MNKIKIFISYSHQNEDWVSNEGKYKLIPWLEKQLNEQAEIWTDHALKQLIGEEYTKVITQKILESDIAILLVSQDYTSSQYIMEVELPLLKQQCLDKKIKILPLLITNLTTRGKVRISWIFDLQIYPNETKPLIDFFENNAEWNKIKIEILEGIEVTIEQINLLKYSYKNLIYEKNNLDINLHYNSWNPKTGNKYLFKNTVKWFKYQFTKRKAILLSSFLGLIILFALYISLSDKNKNVWHYRSPLYIKAMLNQETLSKAKEQINLTRELSNEAEEYSKKNEYDKAIEIYLKIIKIIPDNPDLYKKLSDLFYKKGDTENARLYFLMAQETKDNKIIYI